MPVATAATSAAGPLALLYDDDQEVRHYALQRLQAIVPQFWAEISDHTATIEGIYFSEPGQPTEYHLSAALLASKTYYYMGILEEAITFALSAGRIFEKEPSSEYKETIIAGCIDRAIAETAKGEKLSPELQRVVDAVLKNDIGGDGKLAVGLALSLRRLDLIESLYRHSQAPPQASTSTATVQSSAKHDESLLRYVLSETVSGTSGSENLPVDFRKELLALLLKLFLENPSPDYNSITTIWVQTNDSTGASKALAKLIRSKNHLEAYQIAFDLAEVAPQQFILAVRKQLVEDNLGSLERAPNSGRKRFQEKGQDVEDLLDDILTGVVTAELHLNFLSKSNQTDMSILKVTKDSLEDRYSIYHSAITFTNAYASCGTTSDRFLRENLDFLGRASNWAKFSTTAALGLIHRGSLVNGERVLQPYLPRGSSPNPYSEGGALFALGLIYAGKKEHPEHRLRDGLTITDPVVQHGAALGLGVSAMGTEDEDIYGELQQALFQDDATVGEAAGYAMGLIMLGSASEKAVEEMLTYARETQHEKIIRSLAIGLALIMYDQRERADPFIEKLTEEKDAILRYGGMFTIGLAYAGTGSNKAVKKLLHVAVSDVNDDVRRAAVTALGFVLFRNHTQVPRVVQLLSESYNPHVRHGATLALGISCAGTGLDAAVNLLEPMTKDPVDFVRQGAYISLALVLIQQSEAQSPKSAAIREMFAKVTADKHEDPMARFGASIAQGIIDAGGRNMSLSLSTRAGTLNTNAIVGLTLFVQLWYWFPLAHGLGLAFTPTTIITLDEKLLVPKIDLQVHAKPSTFAYYTGPKEKKEEEKKQTTAAVLSTTARAKARAKSKKQAESGDVEMEEQPAGAAAATEDGAAKTSAATKKAAPSKPSEPSTYTIQNMSRVTPLQSALVSLPSGSQYAPLRPIGDAAAIAQADKLAAAAQSSTAASSGPAGGKRSSAASSAASRGLGAGSSIVIMRTAPGANSSKQPEYIELDRNLWPHTPAQQPQAPGAGPAADAEGAGVSSSAGDGSREPGAAMSTQLRPNPNAPEASAPGPFEYPFED